MDNPSVQPVLQPVITISGWAAGASGACAMILDHLGKNAAGYGALCAIATLCVYAISSILSAYLRRREFLARIAALKQGKEDL